MTSTSGDDSASDSHISDELGSADPFRRAKATLRLGRHADPQALDQLLALLDDSEWRVVEAALKALRHYHDPRIVPAVQAVAARKDSFLGFTRCIAISRAAARALRSQGEAGFQALLTMLHEFKEDEIWGQNIERQLAVLHDPRAIEPLIACFDSPVYEVAYSASRAMRHFGAAAIPPLIEALSTTDQSVYYHVAWALRWIGAPAVPALLDALQHADDENIRSGAAAVLDRDDIDNEEVRDALYAALDDPDEEVSDAAMWSLGRLGDPRVLELLLAEENSADTLADIGTVAVPPLIAVLEDQARPAYQRVNAARALGLIEDERTVAPLIAALRDGEEDVRVAAISALGNLKYAETVKPWLAALALEPLLAAAHDPSPAVRRGAIGELAAIDDERAFDEVVGYIRESGEGEEGYRSASGILRTLALHHGERTLTLLREMAHGSDRWRWLMATSVLWQLGAPAVPVLLEIARDPRPERRVNVISWLKMAYRHSPDPRIIEFLFDAMHENDTSSSIAGQIRYHATLALGECGDVRAVGPLLEILQNAARHLMMRSSVVWQLGELGDEQTLEALTAIFEESKTWEGGIEGGDGPRRGFDFDGFQDALLSAMEKIRKRLGTMEADADSSGSSDAT